MTPFQRAAEGCRIRVRAQPRASRSEVAGEHGEALRVRIAAPPVDGAANEELIRFLAERLGIARRRVTLVGGATGREKLVAIEGVEAEEARRRLAPR
jgi:uncharacterized protein (TIGR00251 family)